MASPTYSTETPTAPSTRARAAAVAAAKGPKQAAPSTIARRAVAPVSKLPAGVEAPSLPGLGELQESQVLRHPDYPHIFATYVHITPDLADFWKTACLPDWQRNESDKTTDEYTEDMSDGDWLFTAAPYRFTRENKLMDGQHRASSIAESGVPQTELVVWGLDRDAMRVIDTGYQRRFTNYLSTQGVPYVSSVANVTGRILDWQRGNYATPAVARQSVARHLNAKRSHQKLIHVFEAHREEIIHSVKRGKAIRSEFPGSAPDTVFAFAYLYLNRLDPFKCAEFFDELTGKIPQKQTDATYAIRALEKTLTSRSGEEGIRDYHWLSWMFRTWNHSLDGQPLSRDQFRKLKKPRFDLLAMPDDPNEEKREQGWVAL